MKIYAPPFIPIVTAACVALLCPPLVATADGPETEGGETPSHEQRRELSIAKGADRLIVRVGDEVFTEYRFAQSQKFPYFWPVNGPLSGASVTTESAEPYPHHHSLYFACDKVNGGNYWQEGLDRGQIVSQGVEVIEQSGMRVVFEDTCHWRIPGQEPVLRDERRVLVSAPSAGIRFIDFTIALQALTDVRVQKTNHSLFAARMVPELSVNEGGALVNAHGNSGEDGTWGVRSPWCDYSGTHEGVAEGLAIFQHPANPGYPVPWFTRDYGFFSPTPMYWLEGGEWSLPEGETVTLKYRVAVHKGSAEEADIAGQFQEYAGETGSPQAIGN